MGIMHKAVLDDLKRSVGPCAGDVVCVRSCHGSHD
jgi:hypothetical protein